jgi:hypothetical protein
MSDVAAFRGTFSDLKFLKGRRVVQFVLELPLEEGARLVEAFGAPNPASEVWVGFTRLVDAGSSNGRTSDFESDNLGSKPGPAAKPERSNAVRQAGVVCKEPEFWRFLRDKRDEPIFTESQAAEFVRSKCCRVSSRADIRPGSPAEHRWNQLLFDFSDWRRRNAE